MSRVYVFLADGFEEIEGLTVVDILRRAGVDTTTVSIMERRNVMGSHKIPVMADACFDEVDFSAVSKKRIFQRQNFWYCREECREASIWQSIKHWAHF